jgi:hypothetical protein
MQNQGLFKVCETPITSDLYNEWKMPVTTGVTYGMGNGYNFWNYTRNGKCL